MRIISGKYKGFRFPDKGLKEARPTTDRAKESLFNILHQRYHFDEIKVLDLYAGSGAIGLEFESRGCKQVVLVEWNRNNIAYIRDRCDKLGAICEPVQQKSIAFLAATTSRYDVIFADPPYNSADYAQLLNLVEERSLLNAGGLFILEHDSKNVAFAREPVEQRVYGQSTFSFFTFDPEL